jgi:hypothetical protein
MGSPIHGRQKVSARAFRPRQDSPATVIEQKKQSLMIPFQVWTWLNQIWLLDQSEVTKDPALACRQKWQFVISA